MKVLLVTEFFPKEGEAMTGGVEARTYHVAKELRVAGHELRVISRKRSQITATPMSILARIWFQVTAVIKGLRYDAEVVEGSNYVSYIPAYILARLKKAKAVAWYPDVYGKTWFTTMPWPVALVGYLMEWLSLKLPWDTIIAMSQSTKQKLIQAGVKSKRIVVVYGGVDLDKINKLRAKKYERPTVCTAARLVNYKHIDDLIKAVGMVQKKHNQIQLMIMGEGPMLTDLIRLSNKFTSKNSVHFLGSMPQQEVWRVMKSTHIFSLPSTVEGFGLVTIEAMACGCPFVSADIAPTREITQNGKGGILYQSRNIKKLADGIEMLLVPKTNQLKAEEGLVLAQKYDWQLIGQQTMQVYLESGKID